MKNLLFIIFAIFIFCIIFFGSLNLIFGGVPMFSLFKISTTDAVHVLRDKKNKSAHEIKFDKNYFVQPCGKSENGFYNLAYEQDKFGFRENDENLFFNTDIVLLGDSFGISSCINHPNDLTTKLKKKINNNKILNISISGSGPYYQKEMMIKLFKKNNTKFNTLVWLFYEGNDHEDLYKYYGRNLSFKFTKYSNDLDIVVKYALSSNSWWIKFKLIVSNYLRGFGTLAKYFKTYPKLLPNELYYEEVVSNMNKFLIENNVENKFIYYIPKYTRLAYKKISHPQLKQLDNLKNSVEKTALKYGFVFIDGSNTYLFKKNPLDFFHYNLPTHFNIKGYELLAEDLAKNLIN